MPAALKIWCDDKVSPAVVALLAKTTGCDHQGLSARDKLGEDTVGEIVVSIPGLGQFV